MKGDEKLSRCHSYCTFVVCFPLLRPVPNVCVLHVFVDKNVVTKDDEPLQRKQVSTTEATRVNDFSLVDVVQYRQPQTSLRRHHELRNDRVRMANCALAVDSAAVTRYSRWKTFIPGKTTTDEPTFPRLRPPDAMSVVPEAFSPESYFIASVKPLQPPTKFQRTAREQWDSYVVTSAENTFVTLTLSMSCHVMSASASYLVQARYVIIFTRIFSAKTSRLLVRLCGAHTRQYLPQVAQPKDALKKYALHPLSMPTYKTYASQPNSVPTLGHIPFLLRTHLVCELAL